MSAASAYYRIIKRSRRYTGITKTQGWDLYEKPQKKEVVRWMITNLNAWIDGEENPVIREAYIEYVEHLARLSR